MSETAQIFQCVNRDWMYDKSVELCSTVFDTDMNNSTWSDIQPVFEDSFPFIIGMSLMYTSCVLYYNRFVTHSKEPSGTAVRNCARIWNLLMGVFSTVGAYYTVGAFFVVPEMISSGGSAYKNLSCGMWIFIYVISKPFELIDTLFLILKRRRVITLHWTHHVITLLYCWYASMTISIIGILFAGLNFLVHSVMYTYYFLVSFHSCYTLCKKISKLITLIQIAQFACALCGLAIFYKGMSTTMIILTAAMYSYYMVIFTYFYFQHYNNNKNNNCKICKVSKKKEELFILCHSCKTGGCDQCVKPTKDGWYACTMCSTKFNADECLEHIFK